MAFKCSIFPSLDCKWIIDELVLENWWFRSVIQITIVSLLRELFCILGGNFVAFLQRNTFHKPKTTFCFFNAIMCLYRYEKTQKNTEKNMNSRKLWTINTLCHLSSNLRYSAANLQFNWQLIFSNWFSYEISQVICAHPVYAVMHSLYVADEDERKNISKKRRTK